MIELILCSLVTFSITMTTVYYVIKTSPRFAVRCKAERYREEFLVSIILPLLMTVSVLFVGFNSGIFH